MKRFSAQYVFPCSGPPLKRGVVTTDDTGIILKIEKNENYQKEQQSVEFYNGIIIPGFVNCHCHLELSHLKGVISEGNGLGDFIMNIRSLREYNSAIISSAAQAADKDLYNDGTVLCADICNTPVTFEIKKKSRIRYFNLLEVFGIDPEKADKRLNEISGLAAEAEKENLIWSIVPHSAYSVSLPLFHLLKKRNNYTKVTSIHFMESESEIIFMQMHAGPLMKSYEASGLLPVNLCSPVDHVRTIMEELTLDGNLILVHNTYATAEIISQINKRGNTFWCLCPGSNLYLEKKMPPVDSLISEKCNIVIGTDSLSSNNKLSILSELKTIQKHFPEVSLMDLIIWATMNGAVALREDRNFGSIEPGKKPGLLLLEDVDLGNLKLLPETTVTRLI